jgi:hypothetical protein
VDAQNNARRGIAKARERAFGSDHLGRTTDICGAQKVNGY